MYEMFEVKHSEVVIRDTDATRTAMMAPSLQPKGKFAKLIYKSLKNTKIPCKFIFASGGTLRLGKSEPEFTVTFHSDSMPSFFEIRKYMKGKFTSFSMIKMWLRMLFRNPINRDSIAQHYSFGDNFYPIFLDRNYHLYSHCLFKTDNESLEEAAEHKLATMAKALQLKPGPRTIRLTVRRQKGGDTEHLLSKPITPAKRQLCRIQTYPTGPNYNTNLREDRHLLN